MATPQKYNELYWTNSGTKTHETRAAIRPLTLISQTIQVKHTRHAGHYLRSMGELISDVLLWTLSHGHASVNWPAWIYQKQLCTDIDLEDQPGTIDDRDGEERESQQCNLMMRMMHDAQSFFFKTKAAL